MSCQIKNNANLDLSDLQPHIDGMYDHFHQKIGFQKPPVIVFDSDPNNQANVLGKTAYYDPQSFEVHVFVDGRHPKDLLRSIAHELIHHGQHLEGRLEVDGYHGPGYYLKNDKLKDLEEEAMTKSAIYLREYEDGLKLQKEKKEMSLKEWKNNELNSLLLKKFGILKEQKEELEELTKDQEKLPEPLQKAILKKEKEEGGDDSEEGDDKEKNESVRAMREPNRANFTGQKTDAELTALREEDEEELDEAKLCEKCGGKHYMKEEEEELDELTKRKDNPRDNRGDKGTRDDRDDRLRESIKRTLNESRKLRLKIKRK